MVGIYQLLWETSLAAKLLSVSVCCLVLRITTSNPFRIKHLFLSIFTLKNKIIVDSLILKSVPTEQKLSLEVVMFQLKMPIQGFPSTEKILVPSKEVS